MSWLDPGLCDCREGRTWLRLAEIEFGTAPRLVLPHTAKAAELARSANDTRTLAALAKDNMLIVGRNWLGVPVAVPGCPVRILVPKSTACKK